MPHPIRPFLLAAAASAVTAGAIAATNHRQRRPTVLQLRHAASLAAPEAG